ncbi:hypothetical protein ACFVVL_26760 [Kitasatospora sp. NPDC058115]|uniref:hypothetical protein n=1 Tax=Kitasatospora sp. NPDC058115 TaxID=3346347 RepID=UPI0036D97850
MAAFLPEQLGIEQLMDRTSLIISSWLPESRALGRAYSSFDVSPPRPNPQI